MRWLKRLGVFVLIALVGVGLTGHTHARAAALLLRFEGTPPKGFAGFGAHAVAEEDGMLDTDRGPVRTRTYVPLGVASPPALVIAHGVHHTGVGEPRLQKFSRSIASAGVMVYTPELPALTDYRIDASSEDVIGEAARALSARAHRTSVGVMGLSFAGGLSLLTAADPRFAKDVAFVVAVGAHDDLPRVARFFFEDAIARPDGSTFELKAHDYGAMVLVYGNVERFFPAADVPAAREAIRYWLWEQPDDARRAEAPLSPPSKAKLEQLFTHDRAGLKDDLLRLVELSEPAMHTVSPHGNLAGLRAPIFLLHGAGDSVIPASETLWLASDAPAGSVRSVLVSPAVVHVELEGEPTLSDQWKLVDFMAQILGEAERESPTD